MTKPTKQAERALRQVAEHVDWRLFEVVGTYGTCLDDAEDNPNDLQLEARGYQHCSRDPYGEQPIYDKVHIAVYDEASDRTFKAVLLDCTECEALDAVYDFQPTETT